MADTMSISGSTGVMAWPIAPRRPFTAEKAGEALSPYAARRCKPRRQAPLILARLQRRQFHTRGAWSQHDGRKARSSSNGPWVPDGGLARRHIFRIAAQELRRILEVGAMVTWAKGRASAPLTVRGDAEQMSSWAAANPAAHQARRPEFRTTCLRSKQLRSSL